MAARSQACLNPGGGDATLVERFLALSRQIENLAQSLKIRIVRGHPTSAPLFEALAAHDQQRVIRRAASLVEIYQTSLAATGGELNSRHLVWSAFKHFGMFPPGDFFDKISDDSIVEVYDLNNMQIFANLAFFEVCSYTFEEISCLGWTELWVREDPSHMTLLFEILENLMAMDEHKTIKVDFPESLIKESRSPFKYRIRYDMRHIGTVRQRGTLENCGFAAIETGEIVSPRLSALEEEFLLLQHHGRLVDVSAAPDSSV